MMRRQKWVECEGAECADGAFAKSYTSCQNDKFGMPFLVMP
jgi:hypothetical protein